MPDVSRSDSQRSDTSLRPRVSFNRDVHVKRIVPREGTRTVGALSRDGHGHFVTAPIRKERPNKSRKELAEEATQVLNQADKLNCITQPKGVSPEKFYTLPVRRRDKQNYVSLSLDRRAKRNTSESTVVVPPKKPPRTTIFDLFKKKTDTKKSNLKRSNSDASNLKSTSYRTQNEQPLTSSDCEITNNLRINKKLSPIIEVTPREDYFAPTYSDNKENNGNSDNIDETPKSITETLKEFIDEIDGELYRDKTTTSTEKKNVEVVIIDVDKAEKISPKKSKLKNIGAKLKSITNKTESNEEESINLKSQSIINQTKSPEMIHSSQRPADKLPLTKGRTVDNIARRLDNDKRLPPAKPTVMVTPNVSVQHNNNQPFSYTRGLSPDKYVSDENLSKPVIYAQVVCNNDGRAGHKQTIHTTYKKQPNSDSDEGLGNEETSNLARKYRVEKTLTHFGDDIAERNSNVHNGGESPILPKYRSTGYGYNEKNYSEMFIDTTVRGRADGMDAKRRESLTEHLENEFETKLNGRSDLSARRDLLELRINQRINDKNLNKFTKSGSSSPPPLVSRTYFGESPTNKYKASYLNENEPKSFDSQISDYQSSPENRFESSHRRYEERTLKTKNLYKSTPDIYHQRFEERTNQQNSYHDSLKRDRNRTNSAKNKTDKDKFGDSGIENDIIRRDSSRKKYYYGNESEDEGFASSLLITNERQHTDENNQKRLNKKEYDSDRAYSGEDDNYRQEFRNNYVARERNIDDGSHFDPRIDKEFHKENGTLKRTDNKPPKPEKKSGLEKVKQLFSRGDSKKKKAAAAVAVTPKHGMVREESLRARYTEYKGSREHLLSKKSNIDESTTLDHDYNNRRRLSTPSPSPTRETRDKPDTTTHTNWFKSLDRLSRKKTKKDDKVDEPLPPPKRPSPNSKSLRFFGDTDLESSDGTSRSTTKHRNAAVSYKERTRSQSTRDLHNICENPELSKHNNNHKSMTNISQTNRDIRESKTNLKPPASPHHHHHHRSNRDISRMKDDRNHRRKYEISSVESSTEGDSSQQSQRSVVYLHAATVGDIPGPAYLRNTKRTASREELASNSSGRIQPQVKTLSRSFSVLAPWKPRHSYEANNIDYSQQPKPMKYEQKSSRSSSSRKENSSTLKKKAQDTKKSNSTLNRRHNRSSENVSKSRDELKGSSSTLYKKKERLPRENSRYTKERDDRKVSSKSMSVESLNHQNRGELRRNRDISRSISMPKDTEKSAGWFKKKTTTNRY